MIEFRFTDLRSPRKPAEKADVYIGVTADLSILVDGRVVYSEEDFPVIELASALLDWCRSPSDRRVDFEFDSMSTPERGWVWIRLAGPGWRVGSLHQEYPAMTEFRADEICAAANAFAARLVAGGLERLGVDLATWLSGKGSTGER